MCDLNRCFYNVGNALLCKEIVLGHTIIYDCGKADFGFEENISENEEIDAVFISHYDLDHINGIYNLLRKANVKKLILPLVSYDIKFLCLFKDDNNISNEQLAFIIDEKQAIIDYTNRKHVDVIYIKGKISSTEFHNKVSDDFIVPENIYYQSYLLENLHEKEINNLPLLCFDGKTKNKDINNWLLLPYNPYVFSETDENAFFNILSKKLLQYGFDFQLNRNNLKDKWRECIHLKKQIKNAVLNTLPELNVKNYNDYSMTLYSGPFYEHVSILGCLYLGDYNANKCFDELYEVYQNCWNNIYTLQVPHHGSLNNFNLKLIRDNMITIISAKYKTSIKGVEDVIELIKTKPNTLCLRTEYEDLENIFLQYDKIELIMKSYNKNKHRQRVYKYFTVLGNNIVMYQTKRQTIS